MLLISAAADKLIPRGGGGKQNPKLANFKIFSSFFDFRRFKNIVPKYKLHGAFTFAKTPRKGGITPALDPAYKNPAPKPRTSFAFTLADPAHKRPAKAAFTLAEVLITLAIIGVVAAMTIPSVLEHHQKQETVAKLKKAYSTLNQVIELSELDNGSYAEWSDLTTMNAEEYLKTYFLPYFKSTTICYTYSDCGYESDTPWYSSNGNASTFWFSYPYYRIPFIANDGILYSVSIASTNTTNKDNRILVDINGPNLPNKLGKDVFYFSRDSDKRIIPYGYNETDSSINSNCSKNLTGSYCAAKIMRDNWQIKSDYPW